MRHRSVSSLSETHVDLWSGPVSSGEVQELQGKKSVELVVGNIWIALKINSTVREVLGKSPGNF